MCFHLEFFINQYLINLLNFQINLYIELVYDLLLHNTYLMFFHLVIIKQTLPYQTQSNQNVPGLERFHVGSHN